MQLGQKFLLENFRKQVYLAIKKQYPSVEKFCFENDIDKSILSRFLSGKQKDFKISTLHRIAQGLDKTVEIKLK